jgi:heme o synthase
MTTRQAVALLRACHFQPTVAVTAFVVALAIVAGRGWGAVSGGIAVLAGQLTVGWSNDYLDRDRDRLACRADKPIVAGQIAASVVRRSAFAAATVCVPLSFLSGWRAAVVHLAAVASALAYNLWLKATVLSVVPYLISFGLLPAFVSLGARLRHWPSSWVMVAAAILGGGAHFVNTLPDLQADAVAGMRGLPHRLGATGSLRVGVALFASATGLVAVNGHALGGLGAALVVANIGAIVGVVVSTTIDRPRTAWTLVLLAAALTVALYIARAA